MFPASICVEMCRDNERLSCWVHSELKSHKLGTPELDCGCLFLQPRRAEFAVPRIKKADTGKGVFGKTRVHQTYL